MVKLEMTDVYGNVYPVLISSGAELVPHIDEDGVNVIEVLDASGRTLSRLRWDSVLSAAVEHSTSAAA